MTSFVGPDEGVVWCGPVFDPSGYADEGRGLLCALEQAGEPVTLRPVHRFAPGFREGLPAHERKTLEKQAERSLLRQQILIQHHTADGFIQADGNAYRVGRTMFETDSIPPNWVRHCNEMDELWLPSQFNIDTFRSAGVHVPIVKVPGGIDSNFFHPGVTPMSVPGLRGTVFLAVFEWRLRKGWDVLLRAWADAFSPGDDVTLVLRTYPIDKVSGTDNETVINERIDAFLGEQMGRSRRDVAPIVVLGKTVPSALMPSLYRIATALVAPTRGEGWGRPFMEAMASGVPVIATRWSAHLEFMNDDNSLLIDIDGTEDADGVEVPLYREQQWAAPTVSHLRELLQRVHRQPVETRALGARARHDMVTAWPWSRAADAMISRLGEIRELLAAQRQVAGSGAASLPPATSAPAGSGLCVNARLFDRAIGESTTDRVIGHLIAHWPHRSVVRTRVAAPLRPPMSSPVMHAHRACVMRDTAEAQANSVDRTPPIGADDTVLTWLDGASTQPMARPACAYWTVHTGDMVGHKVPHAWVRILRDTADDVWVPSVQAYQACLNAGIATQRLWLMPPVAAPGCITANGPRQPLRSRSDTVFLLPAVDASQSEAVNTILKTWQRAFDATQSALLIVYAPESTSASVNAWHQQMIATLTSGRLLFGAPIQVWRDRLAFDELVALVRSADVVLDPSPTPGTLPFVQAAVVTHRAVITGGRPAVATERTGEPADEAQCASWHVQQSSGVAAANAWRDVLRAATNQAERTRRVKRALERAAVFIPAEDIAVAAANRLLERIRPENGRHLALVARQPEPFVIHGARTTTILAHVDWHDGTGSGVLQSYMRSFSSKDDVSLVLCLDPAQGVTVDQVASFVHDAIQLAGKDEHGAPDIILVPDVITDELRGALIARCDAVVAVHDSLLSQAARMSERRTVSSLSTSAWRSVMQPSLVSA